MLYIAQRWLILTWSVQNIKNMCKNWKGFYWLTRFCEVWDWDEFRTDIRLHWTAPLEPDFFSYTVSRVPNLPWLRFVLVECFSYHYCSRIWSPAQFLRYTDGQYYLYQYYLYQWLHRYIYSCSTYTHVFHVQLHQLMRYTYPNIFGVFTAESLT